MKILKVHTMKGPNCWSISHHKLIVMDLELGQLPDDVPIFADHLRNRLSDIFGKALNNDVEAEAAACESHGAAVICQAIALTAVQLQEKAGIPCRYNSTRVVDEQYLAQAMFEYAESKIGLAAGKLAVDIVGLLIEKKNYNITEDVNKLQAAWDRIKLEQLTECIVQEAVKRGIPYFFLTNRPLVQLGYGSNNRKIQQSATDLTGTFGVKISSNKELTKKLLRSFGVTTPHGKLIFKLSDLKIAVDEIGFPVVLKPQSGNKGKGVTVNINNFPDALKAFGFAQKSSNSVGVIIERYIQGSDFRLLVINYKFVAAAKRAPAMITGDGVSTIFQLIRAVNSDPRRGEGRGNQLNAIRIDESTLDILKKKGLTMDSILPSDETLVIKSASNLSLGGTTADVTEDVHPDNVFIAERVARIVGLDICGIDFISPDIGIPFNKNGGAVIEVNSGPGFRSHMYPTQGRARNIAGAVLDMLFPHGRSPFIPIVITVGNKNSALFCNMVNSLMISVGKKVGCSCSEGIRIQNVSILQGNATNFQHSELVLKDPMVDLAIMECSVQSILENGLVFHNCDICAIIGIDKALPDNNAIEYMEVMTAATLALSCVLPAGFAVLNADSEDVFKMVSGLKCNLAYFSIEKDNPYVSEHIKNGHNAAYIEDSQIIVYDRFARKSIIYIEGSHERLDRNTAYQILAFILTGVVSNIEINILRNRVQAELEKLK